MSLIFQCLAMVAVTNAFIGVMCFVTWENGFKMLGYKYIARMSVVVGLMPIIWRLIDTLK